MPTFNVCGTLYPYPNVGDNPWGTIHINWASAVSSCLTSVNTAIAATFPNPMTTLGDMIYEDITLTPVRLPIGNPGDVLTVAAGIPSWAAPAAGSGSFPIGAITAWCDFNGTLALDANYRYMDGSVIAAVGSPIDGKTTDDLSGAYIVGYGTLGAGDIGTAPYSVSPVGNVDHIVNLSHTHTNSAHQHTLGSHTHDMGTLKSKIAETNTAGTDSLTFYDSNGVGYAVIEEFAVQSGTGATALRFDTFPPSNNIYSLATPNQGTSDGPSTNNTSSVNSGPTGSSLSAVQSIQPRSQRYRFIVRVL